MRNLNLLKLGLQELRREGKKEISLNDVLDRAVKIRKYLDKIDDKRAKGQFKKKA
jgi:hypothetical protein